MKKSMSSQSVREFKCGLIAIKSTIRKDGKLGRD